MFPPKFASCVNKFYNYPHTRNDPSLPLRGFSPNEWVLLTRPDVMFLPVSDNIRRVFYTYPNIAQHWAVTTPLLGPDLKPTPESTKARLLQLAAFRVQRYDEMLGAGAVWANYATGVTAKRNCPPFGCKLVERRYSCRLRRFCPFCHGRQVLSCYNRLERAMFNPDYTRKPGLRLWVMQRTAYRPCDDVEPDKSAAHLRVYLADYLEERGMFPPWAHKAYGAYATLGVDPVKTPRVQATRFDTEHVFRVRHSMFVITKDKEPGILARSAWTRVQEMLPGSSCMDLVKAVADVCQYPAGILAAPVDKAYYALKAIHRIRTCNSTVNMRPGAIPAFAYQPHEDFVDDYVDAGAAAMAAQEYE